MRLLRAIDDWLELTEWIDNGQTEHPVLGEMRFASIASLLALAFTSFFLAFLIAEALG